MSGIYNLNPVATQQPPLSRGAKTTTAATINTTASVALAANANRAGFSFYNAGPATVFLREGSTVTAALYEVPIPAGYLYEGDENPRYTGAVSMITSAGTATVMVSESVYS